MSHQALEYVPCFVYATFLKVLPTRDKRRKRNRIPSSSTFIEMCKLPCDETSSSRNEIARNHLHDNFQLTHNQNHTYTDNDDIDIRQEQFNWWQALPRLFIKTTHRNTVHLLSINFERQAICNSISSVSSSWWGSLHSHSWRQANLAGKLFHAILHSLHNEIKCHGDEVSVLDTWVNSTAGQPKIFWLVNLQRAT